jgi:uncharacterized protein YfaP (DUF2135 family)
MHQNFIATGLVLGLCSAATAFLGCSATRDVVSETEDLLSTDVSGQVLDDRGDPVVGASVRLYGLIGNTSFVEGGDVYSAQAYIDRDAILASNDSLTSGETGADGRFVLRAVPNAFLAVATQDTCSPGFAGFDDQTGVLNVDTLITPNLRGGLNFEIPRFVVTCATPPEVSAEGNAADAPAFEPPAATVSCDAASCEGAGGTCVADTCTLPACSSDAACAAGQPGAYCENPGVVGSATCRPPLPAEIIPPVLATGWTGYRVTDSSGALLVDASVEGQIIGAAALPADGIVRIYGDFTGTATRAYVQVQSGGTACANLPPRTDFIPVDIADGKLATDKGGFIELALHGGYQRVQLSTSDTLGTGERSFVVQFGEPCAPPAHAFTAILTWDAGRGDPIDLDLSVWNGDGESLCVGRKRSSWGQLKESKCPGPEVFESDDAAAGPFTVKVQSFCGRTRTIQGKVRIIRRSGGQVLDTSYAFNIAQPGDVAEIGVFAAE